MTDLPEILVQLIESDLPPAEKCFSFLKKAIFLGYLKKGHHLVERELVNLLKISRAPVREAIRQLAGENLIAHYPNRGCIVVGVTARDIKEMSELRMELECFLVRKLCDGSMTAKLQELKKQLEEEYASGTSRRISFHSRLLALADHRWLNRFLGQLEEYIEQFHVLSYLKKGREDEAYHEHIAILDTLIARDAKKAEKLARAHVKGSLRAFLQVAPIL